MENLFKKFVYTGVGFVALTTERLKNTIDGLVGDGKISEDEGKKIVDDFMKNTETKKDELENQFGSVIEKIVKSFNFATVSEVDEMLERVSALEEALAKQDAKEAKPAAKKTTKKAATKKKKDEE